MNDLGRRYWIFASTVRGKQMILGALIGLACVLDIVASFIARGSAQSHTVGSLYALSGGMLLAAVVFLFTTRRWR
jgi:uncharacterized YccA/Bax inhibitor family protein